MEAYKLKDFSQWAKKKRISDQSLITVVAEMSTGLLGDRLGANIYKKRLKIDGRGKRGGARVIVLFKDKDLTLFLYGYLKNELGNISKNEEQQLRIFANEFLKLSPGDRAKLRIEGSLIPLQGNI
jgi:hypothetical protein